VKLRVFLMLLISLALAGAAAVTANRWMTKRLAGGGDGAESIDVVAAAAEIPFGTKIDPTLVKMIALPPDSAPEKAFRKLDDVIGRVAAAPLYKGEVLVDGRVVQHLGGSALAAVVGEGKRAITVRVNDVIGVAGFLLPGNRVDVIATSKKRGSRGVEARTLLQDLKVLAVDQTVSPNKNDPVIVRAVTLEADPGQAEEIVQATEEGKVQLTLRNPLDAKLSEAKPEPERPLGQIAPEPQPEPQVAVMRVLVVRGTDVTTSTFAGK
jgi:pilus assembly protein CpaB